MIYSYLLSGITNVTDRAIYYGFYPWFIRAIARRRPDATAEQFRAELRKADCLLTLIAQRHGFVTPDVDSTRHGGSCPGSLKLGPAVQALAAGERLSLNRFANRADGNVDRYFKNALGGLGQYYLGVLRDEMFLLSGDTRGGVDYVSENTDPIADAFADENEELLFFEALEAEAVSLDDLDGLAAFCPCALADGHRPRAQARLIDLIFGEAEHHHVKAARRRGALGLLLTFLDECGGLPADDSVKSFLVSCYCASLNGDDAWELPTDYDKIREVWALYARNEMLSLAWLGLFKAALDCLKGLPKPLFSVAQVADWLLDQDAFAYRPELNFDDLIAEDRRNIPPQEAFLNEHHEVNDWLALVSRPESPVPLAVSLLRKLIARHDRGQRAYAAIESSPDALADYPLNLEALSSQISRWSGLSSKEWMRSLLIEVLSTHQRVAIRKLGQSGEDTLMFRTGEGGLYVDRVLERIPETAPRLWQVIQIIRDLGLCERITPDTLPRLTAHGLEQLARCRA